MIMRPLGHLLLAPLLATTLGLGLAACGSDDASDDAPDQGGGSTAADPVDTGTATPATPDAPTEASYEVVGLYSATAAGGTVSEELSPVGTRSEQKAYVAQFRGPTMGQQVRRAVEVAQAGGDDGELMAAVVSLGCDIPPGVEVTPSGDAFTVAAQKVKDPLQECLAAVTTVAVVSVGR